MNIELTDADAATVKAILMTHSEMQDHRAIPSMELLARLKRDTTGSDDEEDMIEDLAEQVEDFEIDSINLRRIANLIPEPEHASR